MKLCSRYLLFVFLSLVVNSCSNEIEVLADYEENASVYALLDPYQPVQFVKINKVFTNPNARATDVAKISDSLYFDSLSPVLVELDNAGNARRSIPLYKANVLFKDSGIFAHSPNYLYVTNVQIFQQYKYRLDLTLPGSKKHISATTNMVALSPLFNPVSIGQRILNIIPTTTLPVQFSTGLNGKIYDAFLHFTYQEVNKADTTQRDTITISWKILRSFRASSDKVPENVIQRLPGILFYEFLLSRIPVNTEVTRHFMPCAVELIGGNLELDNYIEASTPSIGIVQKQSDYTNVSNGVGLFGARSTLLIDQVMLSGATRNTIMLNDAYKKLGFQ